MNGRNEKAEILAALGEIFVCYNRKPDAETIKAFGSRLLGIDCNWKQVADTVTDKYDFMPSLKQIKDVALGRPLVGDNVQATKVVDEIKRGVERIGRYNFQRARDEFSLEAWGFVQSYGGWSQVCSIDFKAQSTFASLHRTAAGVLEELASDAEYVKRVKLAQSKGTNDSRSLTASPQSLKAPEGDSSFDPRKLIEEAFTGVKTAKNIESEIDIEELKNKAKNQLKKL